MRKLFNVKVLAIFVFFMAGLFVSTTMNAQSADHFFRIDNDDIYSNRDEADNTFSVTIGGMQNEELPLGSGLLIMIAAGAGYAIARRKRTMKKGTTLLLALALMLGMTQCKKQVETVATTSVEKVSMILDAGCGNSRTVFVPGEDGSVFTWSTTDNEYVYIGGSDSGYLGYLTAEPQSSAISTTQPIVFSGTITKPNDTEILYVFYLGNGLRTITTTDGTITIDFTDQSATGTPNKVTNFLIAEHAAKNVHINGNTITAQADLDVKTAVAYFNLSGFSSDTKGDEIIYLNGADVYSVATINFNDGSVVGSYKGPINVGTNGKKYVSLIPSTSSETTLKFDSGSKTGQVQFPNGIIEKKFYSAGVSQSTADPIPVAANSTPTDALPGLFSVAPGKMVRFSKGNLQYTRPDLNTPWSEGEWSFMENQYDIVEIMDMYEKTEGWYRDLGDDYSNEIAVSLFGWGTTGKDGLSYPYNKPYDTDAEDEYGPASGNLSVADGTDWGWSMGGDDSPWRTLTADEFSWLLGIGNGVSGYTPNPGTNCRESSTVCGVANARFTRARIQVPNSQINEGVNGLVIFPDDYTHPDGLNDLLYINYKGDNDAFNLVNVLSVAEWEQMEAAGAVFLPAAGQRYIDWYSWDRVTFAIDVTGGVVNDPDNPNQYKKGGCNYWTSTSTNQYSARTLFFDGGHFTFQPDYRCMGRSVRLVTDGD